MANSFLTQTAGDGQNSTHRTFLQGLSTDGVNDYMQLTSISTFTEAYDRLWPDRPWAISVWVNNPGISPFPHILACNFSGPGSRNDVIQAFITTTDVGYQAVNFNGAPVTGIVRNISAAPVLGGWKHIVWSCDGTASQNCITAYFQGRRLVPYANTFLPISRFGTAFGTAAGFIYSRPAILANTGLGTVAFDRAFIADFCLFTRALTDEEVRRMYNFGSSSDYSRYPSDRHIHLPLSTGNYGTAVGQLFATDIIAARNANVFGQGLAPSLVNIY